VADREPAARPHLVAALAVAVNQPPLDLIDHEFDHADDTATNHRGVRVSTVRARWAARPRPRLPDAQEWSTTLALAVIQALVGRRPVAHAIFCKRDLADRNLFDMIGQGKTL
jgi:hypothetical protein